MSQEQERWPQGCAYPDGVLHDHGHADCHQATAVRTAQAAVNAFLTGLADGEELAICENTECRVRLYTVPTSTDRGRRLPVCPGCYGSPSQ
jgi:hypothetical protein